MLVYWITTILISVKRLNLCSIVTSSCQRIQCTTLVKARSDHDFAFVKCGGAAVRAVWSNSVKYNYVKLTHISIVSLILSVFDRTLVIVKRYSYFELYFISTL